MSTNKREIVVGNTQYPTKQAAAKAHGVSSATMSARLSRGWTLEESLGIEKNTSKRVSGNVAPIIVDGQAFQSQSAAARHFGIDVAIFTIRLHRGWSPEEAAGLEEYVPGERSGDSIMIEGQHFQSHIQAAKHYNISYRTFKSRLDRGWTPEQAADLDRHVTSKVIKEPLIIEGVEYKSISAAAKFYKISRQTFHLRMKNGQSGEEAARVVEKPRANKAVAVEDTSVTVGGMVFENYTKAAEKFNVPLDTFMKNLDK
jgi:hypothetical protein